MAPAFGGQEAYHRAVGVGGAAGLDHDDRGVDVGEALRDRPVHPVVEARAVLRLESRRVDEQDLAIRRRHDARSRDGASSAPFST